MNQLPRADAFDPRRYNPVPLFLERMSAHWLAIWRAWRTVMDWATWLYVLLPGLFIFVGMYRDLLRDPPKHLDGSLVSLIIVILALLQLIGKYRTFAEPGDGLFLHRRAKWVQGKLVSGFIYGLLTRLLISSCFIAIGSPLLLQVFELTGSYLFILVVYASITGFAWVLWKDRLTQSWKGWRRTLVSTASILVFLFVFVWIALSGKENLVVLGLASVLAAGIAGWLIRLRLRMQGTFLHEVAVEHAIYIANVKWILKETMDKKPVPMLRKPVLFSRSQPLVKHKDDTHRLLDSWFKSALRRTDLLTPLLYFTGAGVAATSLPPAPLAIVVWLVLPMLLLSMLHRQWSRWLTEPYIALFKWHPEMLDQASSQARVWGAIPSMTLWALVIAGRLGFSYGGVAWLALAIAPMAGYFWLKFINGVFTSINIYRRKSE